MDAASFGRVGWGGWIRTNVWRDQNPLPYHLATPQHCSVPCTRLLRRRECSHTRKKRRLIETPSNKTRPAIGHARSECLGGCDARAGGKDTGACAREPCRREVTQPVESGPSSAISLRP